MARRKNDIERYLRGEMSPAEMHALEKEALSDPFLSEALEGVQQAGADSFLFDLKQLRSSFPHHGKHKPKIISMWRWSLGIAAGLMLLAVSSVYIIINIKQQEKIAVSQVPTVVPPAAPEEKAVMTDSVAVSKQPYNNRNANATADNTQRPTSSTQAVHSEDTPVESDSDLEEESRPEPVITEETARPQAEGYVALKKDSVAAPLRIIRGKVLAEEDKVLIPGVNVLVKGTTRGTVTDINGSYEIGIDDPKQTLVFAFIGYKTAEVTVENKSEVNLQLKTDNLALSEVVVVGHTGAGTNNSMRIIELASPKGGREAFQEYLKENVRYPQTAKQNKTEGRVIIEFTVNSAGQLNDFKIVKGIGAGCEEELLRLIKEGPAWSPTKTDNKPVNDKVKVRFRFDIPE